MLQTSTIEELFSNLKKKNADIYVQRANKLRQSTTKRTRLLSFNLSSMEFFIFSDRSMTGYETAVDFIQVHSIGKTIQTVQSVQTVQYCVHLLHTAQPDSVVVGAILPEKNIWCKST